MKTFGTQGPVTPEKHYVIPRAGEIAEFTERLKAGRYIVISAPRQTGKTTFFQWALAALAAEDATYLPIRLDFQSYSNLPVPDFYAALHEDIQEELHAFFQPRGNRLPEAAAEFLENARFTNHVSMRRFLNRLANLLSDRRLIFIIDEFDGIPSDAVNDFLHTLRHIYISPRTPRTPHSLGIVGIKSTTQLDYDRSISPFNIQDEFRLSNFTAEEVAELLTQHTAATGQRFEPAVIDLLYKQTVGQPFLVNRFGQLLTETLDIPKTKPIRIEHFLAAHTRILQEKNTNIQHLVTNIRRQPRFKNLLMHIATYQTGIRFNLYDDTISELTTYGVIVRGSDGQCEIANPIYQQAILHAFKPLINGLEADYFPDGTDISDYLTSTGSIQMTRLLDNFRAFIARVGYRILQIPDTPKEFVGQDLLYAYLDQFVSLIGGAMYLEVQTGRGRIDLLIVHNGQKSIIETKIWEGERRYQNGKQQLARYVNLEGTSIGYYVVFDHRQHPEPRSETERIAGVDIQSYVIPVVQEPPSESSSRNFC